MSDGLWQAGALLFTIGLVFIAIGFIAVVLETKQWRPVLWGVASIVTGAILVFVVVVILMGGTISRALARNLQTEHSLQRPSLVEPIMQRSFGDAKFTPPIMKVFFDPSKRHLDGPDPVSGLISSGSPNAVGARIAPVILLPLKRESATISRAHIRVEVLEDHPSFANRDATAAVSMKMGIIGIRAPSDHREPYRDQWMPAFAGQPQKIASYELARESIPHPYFLIRDDDGKYRDSPLRSWFDSLKSKKGPCCSDADGSALSDVDWEAKNGHYRVRIEGQWWDVPEDAVITEPNRAGRTMVWPVVYRGLGAPVRIEIRCFMPGSMT